MPRDQSLSSARAPAQRKSRLALLIDATTVEEAEAIFEMGEETRALAESIATVTTKKMRSRILLSRLLHRWYKGIYLKRLGASSRSHRPEVDLDDDDDDGGLWSLGAAALSRALEHFLDWKVRNTIGLAGEGKPLVRTVREWRDYLLWSLIDRVGERSQVVQLLRGNLYSKEDGVYFRLYRHVGALQSKYRLPTRGKQRLFYGRSELILFLGELKRRMTASPFSQEQTLQQEIILKLAFFTGCRPGAFAQTQPGDSTLLIDDVKIHQGERFNWTIEIDFHNIKGFRALGSDSFTMNFMLMPVAKIKNVVFDLSTAFIPFCIHRGILFDDHHNRFVSDIMEFLTSSSAHFSLKSRDGQQEPLFIRGQKGKAGLSAGKEPLTASNVTKQILSIARDVGLSTGSVYAFRHDVGDEMHSLYNAEAARQVLGHMIRTDTLRMHYSRGTGNMNMVESRLHEFEEGDSRMVSLGRSLRSFREGMGLAVQAVAQALRDNPQSVDLQAAEDDGGPAPHVAALDGNQPNFVVARRKGAAMEDKEAEKVKVESAHAADSELLRLESVSLEILAEMESVSGLARGKTYVKQYAQKSMARWASEDPETAAQIDVLQERYYANQTKVLTRRSVLTRAVRQIARKEALFAQRNQTAGPSATVDEERSARQMIDVERAEANTALLLPGHPAGIINEYAKDFGGMMAELGKRATEAGRKEAKQMLAVAGEAVSDSEDDEQEEERDDEEGEGEADTAQADEGDKSTTRCFDDHEEDEDGELVNILGSSVKAVRIHVMLRHSFSILAAERLRAFGEHCEIYESCLLCGESLIKHQYRHIREKHSDIFARVLAGDSLEEELLCHLDQRVQLKESLEYHAVVFGEVDEDEVYAYYMG